MKYQLEMTETEYVATVNMVGSVMRGLFETVLKSQKMEAFGETFVEVADKPKSKEPDNDDTSSFAADASSWLRHEEAPTADQIGRGPVDTGTVPAEAPVAPAKVVRLDGKNLAAGRKVINELVTLWLDGYKQEDAPQPDRAEALRTIANGKNAYKVLTYVKSVGGLTHAVNAALEEWSGGTEQARQDLVLDVAGNMTQVSSILFPDLSDLYEYKNIFQTEENDDE